jgi:hydrogenase maturation protease
MLESRKRILVLALGNDLMGDDGVGHVVAKILRQQLGEEVAILESAAAGFELMELLEGYERALIVDAITTGNNSPGTVLQCSPDEFPGHNAWSAHYAGLPEIMQLANRLQISFPREIRVLAMEINPVSETYIGLSDQIIIAVPEFLKQARRILNDWLANETSHLLGTIQRVTERV